MISMVDFLVIWFKYLNYLIGLGKVSRIIYTFCTDTGHHLEDLLRTIANRDRCKDDADNDGDDIYLWLVI